MTLDRHQEREPPTIRAGAIALVMGGFFVFVLLVATAVFAFFRALAPDATYVEPSVFPAPRLQTLPDGFRDPEIARQQADLERFRWIDKSRGEFQIPIEQAVRIVAGRGQKAYDPVLAPPSLPKAAVR